MLLETISRLHPFATVVRADLPADCARNYTVHLGDTCDAISAALNVSTYVATVQQAYILTDMLRQVPTRARQHEHRRELRQLGPRRGPLYLPPYVVYRCSDVNTVSRCASASLARTARRRMSSRVAKTAWGLRIHRASRTRHCSRTIRT